MPTKRTRRARRGNQPAFTRELVDFLMGVRRTPQEIDAMAAQGIEYDGFAKFAYDQLPAGEVAALRERCSRGQR